MATPKNLLVVLLLGFAVTVSARVLTAQIVVEHKAVAEEGGAEFKVLPAGSIDAQPGAFRPGHPGPRPVRPEKPDEKKGEPGQGEDKEKDKAKEQEDKPGEGKEKPEEKEKTGEDPKPLSRPTEPSKPGDPEELKIRPDDDGKVKFNFTGQKWPDVLQWLADISEMSLDWQELPGDFLNMTTQRSYTVEEAQDLINRHLLDRGYTMLCQGELMSVVNTKKLNPSMVPRVDPAELEQRRPYEFVKVSFQLDWLLATAAVKELEPMLSPNGKLTALSATNRLEAMDAAINLHEIYRLLTEEQSPDGKDRLIKVFELNHSRAEDVRKLLLELLGVESKASSKSPRP